MTATPLTPYVGPRPFRTGETLYGRDWEVAELRDLLIARRIVLLHAPSGAGKTSLIQAGLIPALGPEAIRVLPVIRIHAELPPRLKADPPPNRYVMSTLTSLEESRTKRARLPLNSLAALSLADYLSQRFANPGGSAADLLIFDQFEEILTVDPTDLPAKEAFFAQLGSVLRDPARLALFAIREDYVASLDPYLPAIPGQLSTRFRIDRLTPEAARPAIQAPAREWGVDFTDGAAERLIDDLRQVRIQRLDGSLQTQPGPYLEPVQLQVVCQRLWQSPRPDPAAITGDDVQRLGGVDNALAAYYADAVARVALDCGVPERGIRDWFDGQLITASGFRSQVMLDKGSSRGLKNEAIRRLIDIYLVREEKRRGITWFELAHDRLIEPVRRDNVAWREASLPEWQRRAFLWSAQGQPDSLLLSGAEVAEAERWLERPSVGPLIDVERDFLDRSRDVRDRADQARSREAERRTNLAEWGWGVIFPAEDTSQEQVMALKEALAELLALRRQQAGSRYREYSAADGHRPGESASEFLARHGVAPGAVNPDKVPYYLLLVGDPETIPFEFQYGLDRHHAVGRLHFETMEEYTRYARSVVWAEGGTKVILARRAAFWGVQNPGDRATQLSAEQLTRPLAELLAERQPGWTVETFLAEQATKAQLGRLLGGDQTPALLFTTGHGLGFPLNDPHQLPHQGALVCQDWPGPDQWRKPIPDSFYFAGKDLPDEARLIGLVVFLWSDYAAGTPKMEDFSQQSRREPQQIAPRAFVARLPQRLLGHPQGGALAVIGHVERMQFSSFLWTGAGKPEKQLAVFESALKGLMDGHTVGSAMEAFNQRYIQLSSILSEELLQAQFGKKVDDWNLAARWTEVIDARNYIVLGDPAVRLPVGDTPRERPKFDSVVRVTPPEPTPIPKAVEAPLRPTERVVCNGVNAATGGYLLPPLPVPTLSRVIQGGTLDEAERAELIQWYAAVNKGATDLAAESSSSRLVKRRVK